MFTNEVDFPTKITDMTDIRQFSQLTEELDTHQQDDNEDGINKAINSFRSAIEKLTTCEDGNDSHGIFNRLQLILCQLENLKVSNNSLIALCPATFGQTQ